MNGFVLAEQGHLAMPLAPVSISGGKTGACFHMKQHNHASIIIPIGVSAAAPTSIVVKQCTDSSGAGATAIPFNYYAMTTAAGDTLGARTAATASGITSVSANDGIFYVIELDSAELADGSPYVQVVIADSGNTTYAAILVVLSGGRDQRAQSSTVIT